jgi:uncharacterized protein YcfJ
MTYLNNTLKAIIIASVMVVTGCSSPAMDKDNENAARNRGAAGGALMGATLGALTGEPGLAVKGAVAGGVTGGVAGSMKDLDDSRQTENTQVLADGHSQDNRSDAEKRVAELEAELRIMELEQQLAEAKEKETSTNDDKS